MYYVYILQSLTNPTKHYTGFTTNLKKRIIKHNNGEVPHTNKYKPWKIITYTAFESEEKAKSFKKYLKSEKSINNNISIQFLQKHRITFQIIRKLLTVRRTNLILSKIILRVI